ncbi:MAG: calcineurin-like phosphoesterase family protein [Pirellulaceae bacterium]|nr:calcineurin-like phosphoesterase family protein [Pirellulaceae bacterium]
MRYHARLYCWVLVWFVCACGAVTPESQADQSPAADVQTAVGWVYEDLNGNGVRDAGEPGLPGVRVSNGRDIVLTDPQGHYQLTVDDDDILFVIKPRNFMTPVDQQNLPQFYYIHKPAGSPANFKYPGVAPTGSLPASINFALRRQSEPDRFRVLMFGDTQPRDRTEVEYMAHDIIEQIIANENHGAAFGVTLGDIVFDDLDVMQPHNEAVALLGIPWYNVLGNHDINYDAADDEHSDETFERVYGPAYYSFDYGPAHFIVVDDVDWLAASGGRPAHYVGGLGPQQLTFIKNDLAGIPAEQLVVLMMHIPLIDVQDRQHLYRLIERRPAVVSLSAHTHYMEHRYIGPEDGWQGTKPHHHIVNVTVCGSWWSGRKDERGIPHATMSDGGPNGYSVMEFDGQNYSLQFRAAGRPAEYQMNIYAPESLAGEKVPGTEILANVFAGCDKTKCQLRLGPQAAWVQMQQVRRADPAFEAELKRDAQLLMRQWRDLPKPHETPHLWRAVLADSLPTGTHTIEVQVTWPDGSTQISRRALRVE